MTRLIRHLGEDYTVAVWLVNEVVCEVRINDIQGMEDGLPVYWEKGETSNLPGTTILEEAEEYVTGRIKWDGCSDWDWHGVHFCDGPAAARKLAEAMNLAFDMALQLLGDKADWS